MREVLRSSGRPLDSSTREVMEARIGHDFGQVRVHTGGSAGDAAAAIGARAFTRGSHVVFGAGEYAPGTDSGRRLLAHELTHVVQQRAGVRPGMSEAGDAAERQADAAADAVAAGRPAGLGAAPGAGTVSAIQRQQPAGAPAPAPASAPAGGPACDIVYQNADIVIQLEEDDLEIGGVLQDLEEMRIRPREVAGMDWPQIAAVLKARGKAITAFEIDRKVSRITEARKRASLAYLLRQALSSVPDVLPWGSETDLAYSNTRPPPFDLLATVRISCDGVASIELISEQPAPVPVLPPGGAEAALKSEFSLVDVTDDTTAAWTSAELDTVLAAFRLLPPTEKPAVSGIKLVRVRTITTGAAAHFVHARSGDVPSLEVSDRVFETDGGDSVDKLGFVGGTGGAAPRSVQTILHEVAHAVADREVREWELAREAAEKKLAAATPGTEAHKKALAELETVLARHGSVTIPAAALTPFQHAAAAGQAKYQRELAAARAAGTDPAGLQLLDAEEATMRTELDKDEPATLLRAYRSWLANRPGGWSAGLAAAAAAQEEWARTTVELYYAEKRSAREQKFVDFVQAHDVTPFTPYARENWPQRPGEFFAEAYSLFLTDPEFVEKNYKVLFDYFATGAFL